MALKQFRIVAWPLLLAACITWLASCSTRSKEEASAEAVLKLADFAKELTPSRGRGTGIATDSMSVESFARAMKKTKDQLSRLRAIDTALLTGDDLIDWKFAQSILVGRELDQERYLPWRRDPRIYMTFTGVSGIMNGPGELDKKVDQIERRLSIASIQMNNGMQQLDTYVPRFQELAVFMAENAFTLFDKEIPEFIKVSGGASRKIIAPAREARATLEKYLAFVKEELPRKPEGSFSMGEETYNAMLKWQYLLPYDADSLYAFGWSQFNATVAELEAMARKMSPSRSWQQLAIDIKNEYPDPHKMIEVHQEWVDKSKEHVLKNNLIPIPWQERVIVVERAEYLRKTSYYGHFNFARAKDKDSIYTSEVHINPFEDQWDEKKKKEYLVEHDWGVIMVTAPHETYAGHHVHGLYQINNPRPLRRNHSISLFSEGWGLYNEQLMRETGFFPNDKILLRQLQLRLWRNARVIYDVGLHTGKMSYDEAISLMTDRVGFLFWAAQLEVDACSASPGYFIGYFTGMMEILKMREDYRKLRGEQFTLSEFHERLLKAGSMPTSLMREALFLGL